MIKTNPDGHGRDEKSACVRCVVGSLEHTHSHAHTHLHKHASAQRLDLEGNNTTLCSEVQYVHMCILKKNNNNKKEAVFVLRKHVYGLCVNWVAVESLSFLFSFFFSRHTHTHTYT